VRIIREGFPDTSNKKRNQMDTTEPQQQRGILKGPVDSQQDSTKPLTTKKNILWDEEAIASHERGTRQKITEPKTPFISYNHETDEILGCSGMSYFACDNRNYKDLIRGDHGKLLFHRLN
jgi:hypothetical protein